MDQSSPWGMVLHAASEWDVSELHKGGVAFLRIDFRWDLLQPAKDGPFQWLHFDRLVRWATERGMWILAGLSDTPEWAVSAERIALDRAISGKNYLPRAYPAQDLAKWENYVRQVVGRYGARGVRYWGIWNEPDSINEPVDVCFWRGTPEEFRNGVLASAVRVIRELGPGPQICIPDLAKSDNPGPWLNPILAQFGRELHAVTIHVYRGSGDGSDVVDRARATRSIVDAYNAANRTQLQLWITETGWGPPNSEMAIASKMQDLVREVRRNPWVRKVFPYVWSDAFNDPGNFKAHVRAVRNRWTQGYKPAINAPQQEVPLERDALLIRNTMPQTTLRPGLSFFVKMTFRNVGRWPWPPERTISLGFGSRRVNFALPSGRTAFAGDPELMDALARMEGFPMRPRYPLRAAAPVPPGGEVTFEFVVSTPPQAGFYVIGWCLVDDNPADPMFFGQGWLQKAAVN